MIRIIAIGKKHEAWIADGLEAFSKRLQAPWNIEWVLLPHSARKGSEARQDESGRILLKLTDRDYVILLDERGKLLDSPTISKEIEKVISNSRQPVIVIGGAYGVSDELRQRADLIWSLSPLVFPHQLVRLMLTEQLYRAQEISLGHPYHHV